jgi:very-short-patch-repair endonuclease
MDPENRVARADRALAALAERQYGVVARRQLPALGVTETMIRNRNRTRRLVRLHRGVYAVGHRRLSRDGWWMAAVLAIGDGAVLSHKDAAALHGLRRPHDGRTDVTTTGDAKSTRSIAVHQTTALTAEDATTVAAIPVTTVTRTLLDLAGVVAKQQLASALSEAERQNVLDVSAIEAAMERTWGRRGTGHANLARVLEHHAAHGAQITRSELERMFLTMLDRHDLPRPRTNVHLESYEVDALWPRQRLIAELDGWQYHRTREDFERDRERDAELAAAGWQVIRVTHRQLTKRPGTVIRQLRRLLTARAPQPALRAASPSKARAITNRWISDVPS